MEKKRMVLLLVICIAITPFVVGFSSSDSTGFHLGGGMAHSRTQYSTGCTRLDFYERRNTEVNVHLDHVKARTENHPLRPATQISVDAEWFKVEKQYLESEGDGGFYMQDYSSDLYTQWDEPPGFALKGGLAWKYVQLSAGMLAVYRHDQAILPFEYRPSGSIQFNFLDNFYASAHLFDGATTLFDMGLFSYGLGYRSGGDNIWAGVGMGEEAVELVFLKATKDLGAISVTLSGSIQSTVNGKNSRTLPLGRWGHLGLGFSIPFKDARN
jgi:hypothetical protein